MPRPQSELTGSTPKTLVARLPARQKLAYIRLGGAKWIRGLLQAEVDRYEKENGIEPLRYTGSKK
jgi:hypothetical protein